MMLRFLFILLLSTVQNVQALEQDLTNEEEKELNRFSLIYYSLIKEKWFDTSLEKYVGKECRIKIILSKLENEKENVLEDIKVISGDSEVCEQAVTAIDQIKVFPAPKNQKVRDALLDINLTLLP